MEALYVGHISLKSVCGGGGGGAEWVTLYLRPPPLYWQKIKKKLIFSMKHINIIHKQID